MEDAPKTSLTTQQRAEARRVQQALGLLPEPLPIIRPRRVPQVDPAEMARIRAGMWGDDDLFS